MTVTATPATVKCPGCRRPRCPVADYTTRKSGKRCDHCVRAADRKRARTQHRRAQTAAASIRWRERHPERYAAQVAVKNAVKRGELVRQPCACGRTDDVEAHHDDYKRPLDVAWLCPPCHKRRHKELGTEYDA